MNANQYASVARKVKASGMSMAAFLRKARVDNSAWTRWKKGTQSPLPETWLKIERTLERINGRAK